MKSRCIHEKVICVGSVGYFADEERAALAYNEAVIAADLADIRKMNRVDASGRPIPNEQD